MSKIPRITIPVSIDNGGNMYMDDLSSKWMLTRLNDGLVKKSDAIIWIEWNEDGTFKAKHEGIAVGRSLLMSPFTECFTWQTTAVTNFTCSSEGECIEFNTNNSQYKLTKTQ